MKIRCKTCGKEIDEIPAFATDRPAQYWDVPEEKRENDIFLTSDSCVIANRFFFVRGCIEIPVLDTDDHLEWGVWVSLKEENFFVWQDNYEVAKRSHLGPFFGWLCTALPGYPSTLNMKTMVHLRDDGIRPYIELEPSDHPLAREQHDGISWDRLQEVIHMLVHEENGNAEQDAIRRKLDGNTN